jgi:peptide/nickel transport system permease protein
MTQYLLRRLFFGVVLIFLSTIVSFAILKASPGREGAGDFDPRLSQEYIEQQRRLFGLDKHPVEQYLNWLGINYFLGRSDTPGILSGNLGKSIQYKQDVSKIIGSRLAATLSLNILTILLTWLVAIPLGIYAAVHQYRLPDKIISLLSFVGMSMPAFFLGLILLWIFAGELQWLPAGGLRSLDHDLMSPWGKFLDYAAHMVVPVVVLTFGALAELQRICRGNMLETLRQQYIMTARAKGLSEKRVIYKHALINAINPLITILGFEFAALFGGAALLENVINYPGMGQLLLEALRSKDQALVMSLFCIGSIMLVVGNLLADLLLAWIDPRVSYA